MEMFASSACFDVLFSIAQKLPQQTSIQQTLEEIAVNVQQYLQAKHLAVLLVDPQSEDLTFNVVLGDKIDLVRDKKIRKGQGVAGWVVEKGQAVLIEDTQQAPRFSIQFLTSKTKDCASIMAVPLQSGDVIYGVLEVFDHQQGRLFTEKDLLELKAIAAMMVVALERVYYLQVMKKMAETDQLTGLANEHSFYRYLQREIELCKRYGTPTTVLLLTLQEIRRLNEEHGIMTTDKILQLIGETLVHEVRKVDTVCKIAPDKFAVIMPNTLADPVQEIGTRVNTIILEQGIVHELPKFVLESKAYTGTFENVRPLFDLMQINEDKVLDYKKFYNVAQNLQFIYNEEKQDLERRQYYRKNVRLAGYYEHPSTKTSGEMLVESLSLSGVGFTTLATHNLTRNSTLRLSFYLDDSRRTHINRLVRIQYTRDRYIGCQFADQKNYDGDLGFYLMF